MLQFEGALQSLLSHVGTLSIQSLPSVISMGGEAQHLNMSERSLRRKIDAAGTSFREILDQVRQSRAFELILQSGLATEAIASELRSEDARSLGRRVKSWTGRSAQELRS